MDTQAPQMSDPTSSEASDEAKENKYLLLLISILAVAVLMPIHQELRIAKLSFGEGYIVSVLFVVVLIFGVHAVSAHRLVRLLGTSLWVGSLVAHTIGKAALEANSLARAVATTTADGLLLAGLIMLTWLILADLFRAGLGMTRDRLRGAACAYLLMGLAWALAYALVETWVKDAFVLGDDIRKFAEKAADAGIELEHMVYYSFVTLTTLGYGDITPVRPLATTLAYLEAFTGQFYLTVLVAMLVGQRLAAWMAENRS